MHEIEPLMILTAFLAMHAAVLGIIVRGRREANCPSTD